MFNKSLYLKITLISFFNIMILNCDASNTIELEENTFTAYNLTINKPVYSYDFDNAVTYLKREDCVVEKVQFSIHPTNIADQTTFSFLEEYLSQNKYLKSLTLNHCGITHKIADHIWKSFRYNLDFSLETLDLSNNPVSDNKNCSTYDALGCSFGAALQPSITLKELHLNNIGLKEWRINSVAAAFAINDSVTVLSLMSNDIDDFGAMQLSKMLAVNRTLQKLNLAHNKITPYGLKMLTFGLKQNPVLNELNLEFNSILKNDGEVLSILKDISDIKVKL